VIEDIWNPHNWAPPQWLLAGFFALGAAGMLVSPETLAPSFNERVLAFIIIGTLLLWGGFFA
jgi:hypothetical protein